MVSVMYCLLKIFCVRTTLTVQYLNPFLQLLSTVKVPDMFQIFRSVSRKPLTLHFLTFVDSYILNNTRVN